VCALVYGTAMSTPELWTYVKSTWSLPRIKRSLSRSGNISLTFFWGAPSAVCGSQWNDLITLARGYFARSRAVYLSLETMTTSGIKHLKQVIDQSTSILSMLHLDLHYQDADFFENLVLYPALVELSLANVRMRGPGNASIPFLS
jgi:hypothetical protein